MALSLDANRLADQNGLGWHRQAIEVQATFAIPILEQAAEGEPALDIRPEAWRSVPFVLARDAQQEAPTVDIDVAELAMDAVVALAAFASLQIALQGDG